MEKMIKGVMMSTGLSTIITPLLTKSSRVPIPSLLFLLSLPHTHYLVDSLVDYLV